MSDACCQEKSQSVRWHIKSLQVQVNANYASTQPLCNAYFCVRLSKFTV